MSLKSNNPAPRVGNDGSSKHFKRMRENADHLEASPSIGMSSLHSAQKRESGSRIQAFSPYSVSLELHSAATLFGETAAVKTVRLEVGFMEKVLYSRAAHVEHPP